jgi:hypothetical protein
MSTPAAQRIDNDVHFGRTAHRCPCRLHDASMSTPAAQRSHVHAGRMAHQRPHCIPTSTATPSRQHVAAALRIDVHAGRIDVHAGSTAKSSTLRPHGLSMTTPAARHSHVHAGSAAHSG